VSIARAHLTSRLASYAALWIALAISSTAFASPRAYELPEAQKSGDTTQHVLPPPLTEQVPFPSEDRAAERGGTAHPDRDVDLRRDGSTFFAFNVCDLREGCGGGHDGERGMVKFRVDLEYDVIRAERRRSGHWYVTMPLRFVGFWDLFDLSDGSTSSPFLEMNYSPALETSWDPILPRGSHQQQLLASLGLRHESNGLGYYLRNGADLSSLSRSWNQAYVALSYHVRPWDHAMLSLRGEGWVPVWSDRVEEWQNGSTRKNHVEDHVGYGLWRVALTQSFARWSTFTLSVEGRMHSFQTELRWNTKGEHAAFLHGEDKSAENAVESAATPNYFHLDLLVHCFFGRGERLITANEARYSCYAGVGF